MSKYTQLASENIRELIEEYIDGRSFAPHDALPSERTLSETLDVNRVVLRKALAQMVNENRLYTLRGKGTFVAPAKYLESTVSCISFTRCWSSGGYRVRSDVLAFDVSEASIKISQTLNISLGTPVYELRRRRYIDETPISIETSYIPVALCPDLDEYDFNGTLSLYGVLEERYGIRIARQQQTIRTMTLSEEEMRLLGSPKDNYAFYTVAMGMTGEGVCAEHSLAISRADLYAITYVADGASKR
jgi:GntR family transcriptional regulator